VRTVYSSLVFSLTLVAELNSLKLRLTDITNGFFESYTNEIFYMDFGPEFWDISRVL